MTQAETFSTGEPVSTAATDTGGPPPPAPVGFACPGCATLIEPPTPGPTRCPRCGWRGEAYVFRPKAVAAAPAEAALPEQAVCVHHPRKRATALCAGTGDYICSLCAVDLDGQTYGAEYLAAGGKARAAKAFDRTLPRPDSVIYTYLICLFIPYVNFVLIPFAFLWVPHAFVLYFRALRQRRENPLFARLMGRVSVVTLPIMLGLVTAGWLVGVVALGYGLLENRR